MEINQTSVPIVTLESKIPPIIVNPEHLGKEAAGQVFTMAIRTKSYRVSDNVLKLFQCCY